MCKFVIWFTWFLELISIITSTSSDHKYNIERVFSALNFVKTKLGDKILDSHPHSFGRCTLLFVTPVPFVPSSLQRL